MQVVGAQREIRVNEMNLTGLMWRSKNSISVNGSNNTINYTFFNLNPSFYLLLWRSSGNKSLYLHLRKVILINLKTTMRLYWTLVNPLFCQICSLLPSSLLSSGNKDKFYLVAVPSVQYNYIVVLGYINIILWRSR